MRRIRVIPVLLMHERGLVKSVKFKNYKYVGDPINAVKIFNEKEVDEIAILDITATRQNKIPNITHVTEIVSEAFMPVSYGGGITRIEQAEQLYYNGVEKIVLNYSAARDPRLIGAIALRYGRQGVVASLDYKANWLGKSSVYIKNGEENLKIDPAEYARRMQDAGAGEIFLNSIDRDGTYGGYDLATIERVSRAVEVPVVACGGAGSVEDFRRAVDAGASAVAAGSMFVFQRPHSAVLISYPSQRVLREKVFK